MSHPILEQGRVLVVDDSPTSAHMLLEALKDDFTVTVASNGKDALDIATTAPVPDLVLLDVLMPGIDGFKVCERLKANPNTTDVAVIFITSVDDESNEENGLRLGAVDYITKPFSLAVVKARVKLHIELQQHRKFLELLLEKRTEDLKAAHQEALERWHAAEHL